MENHEVTCSNCKKTISGEGKLELHEAYCFRNFIRCPKCNEMIDKKEISDHEAHYHTKIKCHYCRVELSKAEEATHDLLCEKQPKVCKFCMVSIVAEEWNVHLYQCGSRTRRCNICNKNIILRDIEDHETACQLSQIEDRIISNSKPEISSKIQRSSPPKKAPNDGARAQNKGPKKRELIDLTSLDREYREVIDDDAYADEDFPLDSDDEEFVVNNDEISYEEDDDVQEIESGDSYRPSKLKNTRATSRHLEASSKRTGSQSLRDIREKRSLRSNVPSKPAINSSTSGLTSKHPNSVQIINKSTNDRFDINKSSQEEIQQNRRRLKKTENKSFESKEFKEKSENSQPLKRKNLEVEKNNNNEKEHPRFSGQKSFRSQPEKKNVHNKGKEEDRGYETDELNIQKAIQASNEQYDEELSRALLLSLKDK